MVCGHTYLASKQLHMTQQEELPIATGHMGAHNSYTRHDGRNYPSSQDTWAHGQGHTPNIELTDGNTTVSSAISESHKDDQCCSKHVVSIHQRCRKDFMFKTFKGFKKQVACETDNN